MATKSRASSAPKNNNCFRLDVQLVPKQSHRSYSRTRAKRAFQEARVPSSTPARSDCWEASLTASRTAKEGRSAYSIGLSPARLGAIRNQTLRGSPITRKSGQASFSALAGWLAGYPLFSPLSFRGRLSIVFCLGSLLGQLTALLAEGNVCLWRCNDARCCCV